MNNSLKEQLKGLGFSEDTSAHDQNIAQESVEENKELQVRDIVDFQGPGKIKPQLYRNPGGELNTDLFIPARMAYRDDQAGFTVESLQPDGMVEIKPIKYSYKTDEGKIFLVSAESLAKRIPKRYDF